MRSIGAGEGNEAKLSSILLSMPLLETNDALGDMTRPDTSLYVPGVLIVPAVGEAW